MTPVPNPFRWQTRIRFIDTDASGRIHYTCMFRYFESAEIEFLRTLGMSYESRLPYVFPRVHVECNYMAAVVHDDLLTFELAVGKIGRASIKLNYHVYKESAMVAFGSVTIVCMDKRTQVAAHIPEDIRAMLLAAQGAQRAVRE
jgi:acyl-CoA thioester hydrolase